MATDESQLADELDARAMVKDEEAARLRAAAAILRGTATIPAPEPKSVFDGLDAQATIQRGEAVVREILQRSQVSELEYIQTLQTRPGQDWTAEALDRQLRDLGKPVQSLDAVRTALARLAKKGIVERTGHGLYKLALRAATSEVSP